MAIFDLADRVKKFISGEISNNKKNEAFDQIQQATGVPIDEKQRAAIIKANVDPNMLLAGFTIKRIKEGASSGRGAESINALSQPGGMKQIQSEMPGGGSISQGGVTAQIPPSLEVEQQTAQAKEMGKVIAEQKKESIKAENASEGTYRYMQQFQRSYDELMKYDPTIGDEGAGAWMARRGADLATHLDELPETKALKIQSLPLANGMAREIEGGRVTDSDRTIYANSLANAISFPTTVNLRNMSNKIIELLDKGGDEHGKITNQMIQLSKYNSPVFNGVIAQVLVEYPELVSKIYGEGAEVQE